MTGLGIDTRNLEALIADPPPKSPYFTLPDVVNIYIPPAPKKHTRRRYTSVLSIWGSADNMTDSSSTNFLLDMLAFSDCNIDFDAMARHLNVRNSTEIQNLLAKVCEDRGFAFEVATTPTQSTDNATNLTPESTPADSKNKRKANDTEVGPTPKRLKLITSKNSAITTEQQPKKAATSIKPRKALKTPNKSSKTKKDAASTKPTTKRSKPKKINNTTPAAVQSGPLKMGSTVTDPTSTAINEEE